MSGFAAIGARRLAAIGAAVALGSGLASVGLLSAAVEPVAATTSCTGTTPVTCSFSGSADSVTVPAGATQATIDAKGAQGGAATGFSSGGLGAELNASFSVTPGETLHVVVGGLGSSGFSGGGGGGSFVYRSATSTGLLIGAAGGGGGGRFGTGKDGSSTTTASDGDASFGCTAGMGGTGGDGGGAGTGAGCTSGLIAGAGGGGGLLTDGGNTEIFSNGGRALVNGAAGGTSGSPLLGADGGFGGGGGGRNAGGGGGGYNGGGGGGGESPGGGGGSFSASPTISTGTNTGNGVVTFTFTNPTMPPHITKAFGTSSIPFGGSTSLGFTVNNPNASTQLTGVGFTDTLPAGLVVATPHNGLTGSCGGGTISANPDTSSVSLTGAALAGGSSCTFSVNVIGVSPGPQNNSTSAVTSNEGGAGNMGTASVTVLSCPASQPFQHLLTAHTSAGTILGGFCVNSSGSGTYTQGSVSGPGIVQQGLGITQIAATGINPHLAGQQSGLVNQFAETAPVFAIGTFSLS